MGGHSRRRGSRGPAPGTEEDDGPETPLPARCTGLLALLLLLTLAAACEPEARQVETEPATPATLWRELGRWSGSGDRQTESFTVTSGALRLTWEASAAERPVDARLRVWLHSAISGRPLHAAVDVSGVGADTVRIPTEPRVAYLLIESDGVEWDLRLEEGVPGATPSRK